MLKLSNLRKICANTQFIRLAGKRSNNYIVGEAVKLSLIPEKKASYVLKLFK